MAAWLNVCRYNPTAGGTTDWTFSSAVLGYSTPALAGVVNGRVYKYRAESADLTQWEMGEGAYNTGTGVLARTTVLANSSGTGTSTGQSGAGTKINFTLPPQVAIVALKEDLISIEEVNAFTAAQISQALQNLGNASSLFPAVVAMGAGARVTTGDVDNLITDGFYFVEGACTNQPTAGTQFYFLVIKYPPGTGYVQQTAWDLTATGGMWTRTSLATVWSSWRRVMSAPNNGTFGQHLTSNGTGGQPAWGSGNRTLLNTLTASASANLQDTTSLTANYQAYELVFDDIVPATNNVTFELQIRSGGSFKTTGYIGNSFGFSNGSSSIVQAATTTFIPIGPILQLPNTSIGGSGIIWVTNPSANAKHNFHAMTVYSGSTFNGNASSGGRWDTAGVIDGVQFLMSSGNITSGTVKVYGIS